MVDDSSSDVVLNAFESGDGAAPTAILGIGLVKEVTELVARPTVKPSLANFIFFGLLLCWKIIINAEFYDDWM